MDNKQVLKILCKNRISGIYGSTPIFDLIPYQNMSKEFVHLGLFRTK